MPVDVVTATFFPAPMRWTRTSLAKCVFPVPACKGYVWFEGLIMVGGELWQEHLSDLLCGAGTSQKPTSREVPTRQQILCRLTMMKVHFMMINNFVSQNK